MANSMMTSFPEWVPFPGQKRKAFVARLDEDNDYDPACGPAPAKLSAVDEEVAEKVLEGGYMYDPSKCTFANAAAAGAPAPRKEELPMEEDVEMVEPHELVLVTDCRHLTETFHDNQPGDDTKDKCGVTQSLYLDGKECFSDNSMHASQPNIKTPSKFDDSDSDGLNKKGVTLVLSNEIQDTLALKKLNEDLILPKQLYPQSTVSNSMVLVEWKPKPTNPLEYLVKHSSLSLTEQTIQKPINSTSCVSVQENISNTSIPRSIPSYHSSQCGDSDTDDDEDKDHESSDQMDVDSI